MKGLVPSPLCEQRPRVTAVSAVTLARTERSGTALSIEGGSFSTKRRERPRGDQMLGGPGATPGGSQRVATVQLKSVLI